MSATLFAVQTFFNNENNAAIAKEERRNALRFRNQNILRQLSQDLPQQAPNRGENIVNQIIGTSLNSH